MLRIISTADLAVFTPCLLAFQQQRPDIGIDYTVTSSADLAAAIRDGAPFDLALSSAMDLQFHLANDGFARSYRSPITADLPDWARWRDMIFAFGAERAVVVVNAERIAGLPLPATRQELIALLRDHPQRFHGAVGTHDVRDSGLGYLFATKQIRSTDVHWRRGVWRSPATCLGSLPPSGWRGKPAGGCKSCGWRISRISCCAPRSFRAWPNSWRQPAR